MTRTEKKVVLTLVGLDGNAFVLLGAFRKAARRQGWVDANIKEVLDEATAGDYNHLLATLMEHCDDADDGADYDDEDDC